MSPSKNHKKARVVQKLIRSGMENLDKPEMEVIQVVQRKWKTIRDNLDKLNFKLIKHAIDDILETGEEQTYAQPVYRLFTW